MNSWHSWSSNSRWLVFSSKVNGPYTQLFLTHIDAEGNDTPPVLLEQFTAPDRAANIPEFVALPPDAIKEIGVGFLDGDSYYQAASATLALATKKGQTRDLQQAADLFATSVKLAPENAGVRTEYALVLISLGRIEEAADQLSEAIRLRPEDPNNYFNLGLVYERAGRLEEADAMYLRAAVLDPTLVEARMALLVLRLKHGRVEEARAELESILDLRPNWYPALFLLGKIQMDLGEPERAVTLFQRAVEANPREAEAHWRLGVACLAAGQGVKAQEALGESLKRFPDDANLMDLMALTLAREGNFGAAETWARRALEAATARGNRGLIAALQSHLEDLLAKRVPEL
jgi:Flp pilus assembly protein TadD